MFYKLRMRIFGEIGSGCVRSETNKRSIGGFEAGFDGL